MGNELVSFIIPTYNAEKTIGRCLESALNQTYKNIEIICCDDCSSDNTVSVLKEYAQRYNNITVLENSINQRAAYSRNQCVKSAKGIYLAQIDDDDYCAPDRIEKQVDFLNKNCEYAFIGSNVFKFDENGVWGESKIRGNYEPRREDFLQGSCFINPSVTFRKEVFDEVNGYRVIEKTRRAEDYDLYMRLYANGYKGYNMKECLSFYYRGKCSYKKCKYIYRIDEFKIRYENFKLLGLMPWGIIYVLKPLIVGLIPIEILEKIKRRNGDTK